MLEMTQEVGRRHFSGAGGEFFYFVFYSSLYTLETDVKSRSPVTNTGVVIW